MEVGWKSRENRGVWGGLDRVTGHGGRIFGDGLSMVIGGF